MLVRGDLTTEDVELEADLGVDSVKQTELLSHAAGHYQLPARPTDFRLSDYSTMGGVAAFVFGALTAPAAQFGTWGFQGFLQDAHPPVRGTRLQVSKPPQ